MPWRSCAWRRVFVSFPSPVASQRINITHELPSSKISIPTALVHASPFRRKHVFNQFRSTPIHTGSTSATRNTSGQRNVWLHLTPFFTQHSLEQPQHPKVFRGHPHCVTGVSQPEPTAETHVDNYFVMRASLPVKMVLPPDSMTFECKFS